MKFWRPSCHPVKYYSLHTPAPSGDVPSLCHNIMKMHRHYIEACLKVSVLEPAFLRTGSSSFASLSIQTWNEVRHVPSHFIWITFPFDKTRKTAPLTWLSRPTSNTWITSLCQWFLGSISFSLINTMSFNNRFILYFCLLFKWSFRSSNK